jgi:O-antigen ligase/tetratricopeptide (TPR) repeat protein
MPARSGGLARALLFTLLLLIPLVFSRETVEAFEFNKVTLLHAGALALAALLAIRLLGARPVPGGWRMDPLALGVLLFVASALVSTLASISPLTSLYGTQESYAGLLTVLAYGILFAATRAVIGGVEDARRLLLAPVVAAAVVGAYAVVQVLRVDPVGYGRISEVTGLVRPFATVGHPNFMAAFLVMAFPLAVEAGRCALANGQRAAAAVFGAIALLAGVGVAASVSRGAWVAFAATLVVLVAGWLAIGERRSGLALGGVLAATAVAVLGLGAATGLLAGVLARLREFGQATSRTHIWTAAWAMFREHPVAGVGLDAFQLAFERHRTAAYWLVEWNGSPAKAHNEALHVLATQGALGGLAALVLAAAVAAAAVIAVRRGGDRPLAVAIAAALAGFAVSELSSFTVAACGTLAVVLAAVLGPLCSPPAAVAAPGDLRLAATLGVAGLVAAAVYASNVDGATLDAAPIRAVGALVLVVVALAAGAAAVALERHDAPAAARGAAPEWSAGAWAAVAVVWLAAGVLAWGFVLRPWEASQATRRGMLLTPHDPARAVAFLERAVALDPPVAFHWVKLGAAAHAEARTARDAAARRRPLDRARAAFERAVELVPVSAFHHANLGRVLADLARDGRARPEDVWPRFDAALARDPANAYFSTDAATAALGLGDRARAARYAAQAAALYPRFALAQSILGHVALADGRAEEAARVLAAARGLDWHGVGIARAVAGSNLAAAYLQLGRPADAERAAREALAHAPSYVDARFNLGRALEILGRRAEALAEYRRIVAEQPDYELARGALRALGAEVNPAASTPGPGAPRR